MNEFNRKKHWEDIYLSKDTKDVSWYQPVPLTSLDFLRESSISPNAKIIDIGGGDSLLADHLLDLGYTDITVLDISEAAINKAKQKLGIRASAVKWIVADITNFDPNTRYDFWHDRAAFHFLTTTEEIQNYINTASRCIAPGGILVLATFSEQGPHKCSGLAIKQYSETTLSLLLNASFEKIRCMNSDHTTPSGTVQNFIFCSFRKLKLPGD